MGEMNLIDTIRERRKKYEKEFMDEMSNIHDFRLRVLFIQLNVEYFLNRLIEISIKEPNYILDNEDLRTFRAKADILMASGVFFNKKLYNIVLLINRVRNYFAHNIVKKDKLPKEIQDRMLTMIALTDEYMGKKCGCIVCKNGTIEQRFDHACIGILGYLEGLCDAFTVVKADGLLGHFLSNRKFDT